VPGPSGGILLKSSSGVAALPSLMPRSASIPFNLGR
jgi:hypothetical protein